MNVYDMTALTIHSNGGMIVGRTVLQRLAYFNSTKIPAMHIPHMHHFYGPFSERMAVALEEMHALSYVGETGSSHSTTYMLTPKGTKYAKISASEHPEEFGKISNIVTKCKTLCDLEPKPLSFAAKAYHILASTEAKSEYVPSDVQRVAKDFDWDISKDDVKTGISLLQELDLVQTSQK